MKRKKIAIILLAVAVLLIVGAVAQPFRILPAYITEVDIFTDTESSPPQYYLRVVAGGPDTCWRPWRYCVTRFGNTIFMQVLTLHHRDETCGQAITLVEKIIPLGRCFIPGMIYKVVVTKMYASPRWGISVAETFVAGRV